MNKKVLFILFFCCVGLMTLSNVRAEEKTVQAQDGISLGEKLVYKITWLGIPIGTGELWVKEKTSVNGREVFHVIALMETNKILSIIFPVHDEAHSWIDAETFESLQFEKKINELTLHLHEKTVFDRTKGKGYFESFKTGEKKEFDVKVPVHDVLSAFFWARRQALDPEVPPRTYLTADQKDWELTLYIRKKEKVKWDREEVETIQVEPITLVEGETKKGKAWFNVTLDLSRKPVRIVYKAPFGGMVGTLQKETAAAHAPGSNET